MDCRSEIDKGEESNVLLTSTQLPAPLVTAEESADGVAVALC